MKIASPLHALIGGGGKKTKKAKPVKSTSAAPMDWNSNWDSKCDNTFSELKERLSTAPVLGYPDMNLPFILEIDASHYRRLQQAFHLASERSEKQALRRKTRNDIKANDTGLTVGARVFLRNRGFTGRNKIQDVWNSVPHVIMQRPDPTGNVYTVAPLEGDGPMINTPASRPIAWKMPCF